MQAGSRTQILEEVVTALTGVESDGATPSVEQQLSRAARFFDPPRAEEACQLLIEACAGEDAGARELEALVVLALSHPDLVDRHALRISDDGLRLAELLELEGDADRGHELLEAIEARTSREELDEDLEAVLARSASGDELVERYLDRAKDAVRSGRTKESITWLREALLVDRSRADIARMIRDLRYAESERRAKLRMRVRKVIGVLVLAGLIYGIVWRERYVDDLYYRIPAAQAGDQVSLRAREQGLDHLLATHYLWLGTLKARRERTDLRQQLDRYEQRRTQEKVFALEEQAQRRYMFESAFVRARVCAESGDYPGSLEAFRRALELAPDDPQIRARLAADVQALEAWIAAEATPAEETQ